MCIEQIYDSKCNLVDPLTYAGGRLVATTLNCVAFCLSSVKAEATVLPVAYLPQAKDPVAFWGASERT